MMYHISGSKHGIQRRIRCNIDITREIGVIVTQRRVHTIIVAVRNRKYNFVHILSLCLALVTRNARPGGPIILPKSARMVIPI